MTSDPILSAELRREIISSFEQRLRAQGNPVLDGVIPHELTVDQVHSVLDEVVDSYQGATETIDLGLRSLRHKAGARAVIVGIRPAETVGAASALFEAALPVLLPAFSAAGRPDADVSVALVLHRVIMHRVASSATSFSGHMLASHRAELARLARDLHDHTAHTIGVAIQNLELHEVHARRDVAQAHDKLRLAHEAMRQALDSVRHFSAELHATVRPDELERALTEYLAANAEGRILTTVTLTGDTAILPQEVCQEVYVTLREAIRNALVHSGTTRLDVTVGISESRLHARVSDTGQGFSVEEAAEAGEGIGLCSMRERVRLLGGTLRLSSLPGHGTTVDMSIPLGGLQL